MKYQSAKLNQNLKTVILLFSLLFTIDAFSQIPSYLSPNSLVGYWPFNGNTNDVSGNGNNGVLNGATLTKDREGNPNSAYRFSNKTDLITIPASFYTPLDSNFTISFWIKSNYYGRMDVLNLNDGGLYQTNFNMIFNDISNSGTYGINSFWNSGGVNNITSGVGRDYTDNEWRNFLISRNNGVVELYINGQQISNTTNYASIIGMNNSITISGILYPFFGDIDDLIIYDRAVSSSEIYNIVFNSNTTPYITSPKVTDSYFANDTVNIKWATAMGYDTVKIQYSINNGINWQMIANNISVNALSYSWIAPNAPGAECLIKLTKVSDPTKFALTEKFLISKYKWQLVNDTNAFSIRDGAGAYTLNNKMYLVGGWNPYDPVNYPNITTNEVWESTDGSNWTMIDTANWEGRHTFGNLIHKDTMWVVGGDQLQGHFQRDVWKSGDGLNWNKVCDSVPWADRMTHMACSFNNKIWVMGGQKIIGWGNNVDTVYNDVWNSSDGVNWNLVTDSAAWDPRGQINKILVFNNKMWIIGGGTYNGNKTFYNDIWNSTDGINWNLVTRQGPWVARQYHDVIVYDNVMWVIGGYDGVSNRNDVWFSQDGITWHELKNTPWPARHASSIFNYSHSLWVVAGNMWNDSWRLNTIVCPTLVSPIASNSVVNGNQALFVANYSSPLSTYTWQVKNGSVWQNVSNSSFLNGANNDTLKLNPVSFANSGQQYRCISESGSCVDTTNTSVLSVLFPTVVKENILENSLLVYPNPANDLISVAINDKLINSNYTVVDQLGRQVLTGKLNDTVSSINIEKLSPGYYILVLDGKKELSYKLIKL